jgi:ParB-like chromosome segregation protein Spo0J
MLPPHSLMPAQRNARTHSKKQIRQIAASIERFGVINPLVADDHGRIVAGHARAEAAKLLGLKHVPVIRLSHLSETEIRAYILADNKLAEKAGWDRELLTIEICELTELLPAEGLDVSLTGFDIPEIDLLLADMASSKREPEDVVPPLPRIAVTQRGDLWQLGKHRLLCGEPNGYQIVKVNIREGRAQSLPILGKRPSLVSTLAACAGMIFPSRSRRGCGLSFGVDSDISPHVVRST